MLEKTLEVPWIAKRSNQSILKQINSEYSLEGLMLKLQLQQFGHLMQRADSLEKTLMLGKIEGRRRRGRQDEMVGWHHRLDGHESEQALGDGEGQGCLACCRIWGRKESDTTEWLNNKCPHCSRDVCLSGPPALLLFHLLYLPPSSGLHSSSSSCPGALA